MPHRLGVVRALKYGFELIIKLFDLSENIPTQFTKLSEKGAHRPFT